METRRFRVVMRAESHLRLMERPGDDARRWNLNLNDAGAGLIEISIFDEIEVRGEGVPVHVGVRVVVDRNSFDLDAAVAEAEHDAAVALALLSASARAPTDSRTLDLAYEITSDADVRQIRQWFWNTPIVVGKTPVPEALFGDLFTSFTECTDEKLLWRITQSISWHQRALAEADAVARFTGLWIACEALEPRLRELFEIKDEKSSASLRLQFKPLRLRVERPPLRVVFPGLKALADADGAASDLVRRGYTLRNDLFHARRVAAPDLVARARDLIPGLEGLLPSAWSRLLGISERTIDFPEVSVVPHRVGMFFDAELLHQDEKQWDKIRHPHFTGTIDAVRKDTGDPGDVSVDYPTNLSAVNLSGTEEVWRARGMGIVGPSGPNRGTGGLAGPPEIISPT